MSIRILLVDDHKILRTGLRSLLQSQQNLEIVGEADNGRRAIELTKLLSPDVVIMDVGMPDLNGFEATGQVVAQVPKAKVLALSMHSDKRFVRRMFQAGAMGYLLNCYPGSSLKSDLSRSWNTRCGCQRLCAKLLRDRGGQLFPHKQRT
jgi:DNA-binding NarL/FixJ family response regulator